MNDNKQKQCLVCGGMTVGIDWGKGDTLYVHPECKKEYVRKRNESVGASNRQLRHEWAEQRKKLQQYKNTFGTLPNETDDYYPLK